MRSPTKDQVDRVKSLEDQHGKITPEIVFNDAMLPDSPLHSVFNWDKDAAAYNYWMDQARELIRSIKIIVTTEEITIKSVAYVRDPSVDSNDQGYISIEGLRSDDDMARDAIVDEFKRAGSALQRAQRIAISLGLEKDIDSLSKQLQRIRRDVDEGRIDA